ncbi:A disintegrin and metalloproteinase with thrombospondin motifs 7 [Neolamprologus brichardi]|uniref:A disintegrin and metalloproteinase with thrombospondin motifs 7 n=1 Tax=Neolamprologus brichardi TaxID=32507 RepID=UPI001643B348|nr:A disintegrin and metalloproteinase with thrombospondin motifs 7 [Neolamprologus brichardi]
MTRLHCGLHAFGQRASSIHFFIAVLVVLENCKTLGLGLSHEPERFQDDFPLYEVVHPTRVDAKGHFLSNFLSHHARRLQRREASVEPAGLDRIFYQFWHGGHNLHFNLTLNPHLLAPGFMTERRFGGLKGARIKPAGSSHCHFLGEVWDDAIVKGSAAISTCDGLTGLFKLSDEEFFIQPLETSSDETSAPQAHAIYKRCREGEEQWAQNYHQSFKDIERQRERWERRQQRRRRRIRQRSVSKEKWVETLVVADPKMVDYHGSKAVESYILAVMNIVAGLYRDASIGNAINIVVVRLILLEKDEDDLKITHHADNSLNSFCKWQKKLNMKGDEHPLHHDVAVLLTRKDICASVNTPCETLGLSHVAGMCQPHRSCSISEDTGLPLAFTVAHELGHNRGWGWCLDDAPVKDRLSLSTVLPGVLYSAVHQCRLQYGSGSLLCDDMDNVCSTLWCTVGTTCHSKLDGAVDGTSCGEDKVSFSSHDRARKMVVMRLLILVPRYRGKYCLGERRRYKICNTTPCLHHLPTFRDIQCSHFNSQPYKGKFYKWEAVINTGYVDIGLIPEGAWDIHIEELGAAGNFLALRSDNPSKYFLNGGWTIQWNGEYKAAGTVFTYERTGQLENLTSPGPTTELLWIQLLFQEANPGVRYEYTISQNVSEKNNTPVSVFYWKYGSWTECSVTCGTGVQRQIIHCVEKTTGIVEEHFCDHLTRLDHNQTSCNKDPCPAIWWVGEWQKCSATCGSSGQTKRTVLCIQALSAEEQKALEPSNCEHIPKPESLSSCNTHIPCPADWTTGSWSKCSLSCGSGVRHRNVTCSRNTGVDCDPQKKPLAVSTCYIQECPQIVDNFGGFDWSGSGWSSKEVLNEINPIPEVKPPAKYSTTREQPRVHNDLNDIVEGDFHYHNNIENTDHSQDNYVPVDDFYYDYNFINFHEDLSDDFGSNGNNSVSHGLSVLQEVEPTHSVKEDAHIEIAATPTATSAVPKPTAYTLETENPQNTKVNVSKGSKNAAEKEVLQSNSENLDDYLSEDFLLPVSTTHSPLLSTTQQSKPAAEKHGILWLPENISAVPSLGSTTKQPLQDVKWGQYAEEAENNYDSFSEEENDTEDVTMTPKQTVSTPRQQTAISTPDSTVEGAQETKEYDNYDYISADQEDVESPEPSGPPTSETTIQIKTEVPLDENTAEIPQASRSTLFSNAFTMDDVNTDQTNFDTLYATTENYSRDTDRDLSTTSLPASEKSIPPPVSSLLISGNQEASTSLTGTAIIPPTQFSPADFPTHTMKPIPSKPEFTKTTGTYPTSQAPLFDVANYDYNEIAFPPVVRSGVNSDPGSSYQVSTSSGATPQHSTTSAQDSDSLCKTESDRLKLYLFGQCSNNCEGGIKLREVHCFDLRDQRPLRPFHCRAMSSRPQTTMSCNLQPCLEWYTSSWGQCSASCGVGVQHRLIKCVDTRAETDGEVDQAQCHHEPPPEGTRKCNTQECESVQPGE